MPCTSPIVGYQPLDGGSLKFGKEPPNHRSITISCGQCADCRLAKSVQWAIRCVHEAQMHDENAFLTLTYNEQNLPAYGSLFKPDLQRFFKRLRKQIGASIRYYACGEYGDQTARAHYHVCLFGYDFPDKVQFRQSGTHRLYTSHKLDQLWGHGNTSIGELNFETAAYTARYVMKKTLGKACKKYVRLDEETGELIPLVQPFAVMSLKPAIGKEWLQQYHGDIYNADKDTVIIKGRKLRPPKYYDKIYDTIDNDRMQHIKKLRVTNAEGVTNEELRARAEITRARITSKTQI